MREIYVHIYHLFVHICIPNLHEHTRAHTHAHTHTHRCWYSRVSRRVSNAAFHAEGEEAAVGEEEEEEDGQHTPALRASGQPLLIGAKAAAVANS